MADRERLCRDPALGSPDWASDPTTSTPAQVALEHFQHQVIRRLLDRGVSARQLSDALGQGEQSWRSKLNGSRRLTLEDLLALVMAVDHTLADLPPLQPNSVRDLIPATYWEWLTHSELDRGMPRFERPSPWPQVALVVDEWWEAEIRAGRQWAISRDVVLHRLLYAAEQVGLSSSTATIDDTTDQVALDWISEDTHLHLEWTDSDISRERLNTNDAKDQLRLAADRLWEEAGNPTSTKIVAVAAQRTVRNNLHDALLQSSASDAEAGTWQTASLTERNRLGLTSSQPDIVIQLLHRSRHAPIDWYAVK